MYKFFISFLALILLFMSFVIFTKCKKITKLITKVDFKKLTLDLEIECEEKNK